jgi:hypothetical protein
MNLLDLFYCFICVRAVVDIAPTETQLPERLGNVDLVQHFLLKSSSVG